jgi:hypothetical protein
LLIKVHPPKYNTTIKLRSAPILEYSAKKKKEKAKDENSV